MTPQEAKEVRSIRDEMESEGYHYPNDVLVRLSALIDEVWDSDAYRWVKAEMPRRARL